MTTATQKWTLADIGKLDAAEFSRLLGTAYENSPWIARRAFAKKPFATRQALHLALYGVVLSAKEIEKLDLLIAHPELAGREAEAGTLTAASKLEQAGAGLNALTRDEVTWLKERNGLYRNRFGFPFIIAVRLHSKASIFAAMQGRLNNTREQEMQNAIAQVGEIARLRIDDLLRD